MERKSVTVRRVLAKPSMPRAPASNFHRAQEAAAHQVLAKVQRSVHKHQDLNHQIRAKQPDLNTTLPVRQTASIFKQPVTKVTNHPSNKVKTDLHRAVEQPKQLFWERKLSGLSAFDIADELVKSMELPKGLQGVGPAACDKTLLSAIASALHAGPAPVTGQLTAAVEKNPGVWLNTAQPLCKAFVVTDEDIRKAMEESYETFEEELGPREDSLTPKALRQIRQAETYASRKAREEMSAFLQPPKVPQTSPREPTAPQKSLSMQNPSPIETPWENVTLNRCLLVAISILVLTSGFHRLHGSLRSGKGTAEKKEQEVQLSLRQVSALSQGGRPPKPEKILWEVLFWWLLDLDGNREKQTRRGASSGTLRNKPIPDKNLMKHSQGPLKTKRAKKAREQEAKDKREKHTGDAPPCTCANSEK